MVRAYEPSDLSAVMQIWLETNIQAHPFIPEEYWRGNYEWVKGMIPQAELYVFCAEGASEILGFIGLDGEEIEGIFVRGSAQSRGVGKQLLDHVKNLKPHLTLHVYQKNERALHFYQREGFSIQKCMADPDTGEAEFLMGWA